jgi:hypothetical protein
MNSIVAHIVHIIRKTFVQSGNSVPMLVETDVYGGIVDDFV